MNRSDKMKREMTFTEGNLFKKMNIYAIPLILSGLLQLLFSTMDLIVCRQYGSTNSVGAITSTSALVSLIINLFIGISVGTNVLMARAYGVKDKEKGQSVVYSSMWLSIIIGAFVSLFGFIFSRNLLQMQKTPDSFINLSDSYLKYYFIGVFFMMIYNFGSAILRAVGDTVKPFIFLAVSGVVNIIFNYIFVLCFKMDVAGVGIATAISQAVSALLIIISLFRRKEFFHFNLKEFKMKWQDVKQIIMIGVPAGFQSVVFSISNVIIQSSINELGDDVINGSGAASQIEAFIYTSMEQTCFTSIAFISANYATHNYKNIKKIFIYSYYMIFIYNIVFSGITLLIPNQLLNFFVKSESAMGPARERLIILAATYSLCGLMDVTASAIRAINHQLLPTILTTIGICGTRLIFIYGLFENFSQFHNLKSISWSYPVSWLITWSIELTVFIIMFNKMKNKWIKKEAD
jgi:putative MATE family efflux protein